MLKKSNTPQPPSANMERRIEPTNVSSIATESPQVGASQVGAELQGLDDVADMDDDIQEDMAQMDGHTEEDVAVFDSPCVDSLQQQNDQANVRKSKSSKPRSMKSRSVAPDWNGPLSFNEKEDVLVIDAQDNQKLLSGTIQPPDIDGLEDGFRCIVHFNDLNQPLRRAGDILVKYLGWLAKIERYCPIGVKNWHGVNNQFKADILERVRGKFIIPDGQTYDKAILMRVGRSWKQYRFTLKKLKFDPTKRTREQIINDVPQGHTKDNWIRLIEYWYSEKCQKLSSIGKEARRSQSHVHTTGSTSYANKRVDFVESKGKEPSHIEFFELTHKKSEGGFVDNTLSSQFMGEANSKVQELISNSSPTKSRTEIENEVFNNLMYEETHPKRPVGFGYGVKQSQVFGVQSILKKRGIWAYQQYTR